MKILIANQAFHPDVVSTAQHAADVATALAQGGHEVTVLASRAAYDQPQVRFAARERWRGIEILRISSLTLSRTVLWKRAAVFASFLLHCALRMWILPRQDMVIVLTSPPLLCFLGALLARFRGARLVLWIMDLNPDEAVAAGCLRYGSILERCLRGMLHFSLRTSERVIVLDRFMFERIIAHGVPARKVAIVPPWPHSNDVTYDEVGREIFRRRHQLEGKFVVMYSGNHSPCHPLDTLLEAALHLRSRSDIAFCFVGGGVEFEKVRQFASDHALRNIVCLGYQPRWELSASLSAADLHTVVMGDAFVGIVHPCKIYNILTIGTPILYVGPEQSPITDVGARIAEGYPLWPVRHGDHLGAVSRIAEAAAQGRVVRPPRSSFLRHFSQDRLVLKFIEALPLEDDSPNLIRAEPHAESV
jgi:colanic acid biosynthesis glycosyl transferase WcaI